MSKKIVLSIVVLLFCSVGSAAAADPSLQVWYTLDDASGEVAHDGSSYGRDAVVDGPTAGPMWAAAGGRWGGYLEFDDNTDIEVPTSALGSISDGITISVWLKDAYRLSSSNWVFEAQGGSGSIVRAAVPQMPTEEALWRAGNDSNDQISWDFDGAAPSAIEGWHLWTFVKDEVADNIGIYYDAQLVASSNDVASTLADVAGTQLRFGAGSGHANDFVGKMDDIRVYDAALTAEKILELFFGGLTTARSPIPASEAGDICPGATLCWTPGGFAAEHDLYLGTDYNDVNDADTLSVAYVDRQEPNCFSPGLDMGTTYYWRIDEVNDPCVWKGEVWRFTTNDGNAFNPDPADEQTAVSRETVLSWTPGCTATSHKVYFSADFNEVNERQAAAYIGEVVGPNTIDPCAGELEYSTYYYWAVDGNDGVSTWSGKVWSFRAESPIIDVNMVGWYKLDEDTGEVANDSSGYEHHAFVDGPSGGPNWDPNDGHDGGSLVFDDDTTVLCPKAAMSKISDGITVSLWLKDADRPGSDNWVFEVPGTGDLMVQAAVAADGGDVYWQAGNDTNDVITWDLDGASAGSIEGWHHWAFVKGENPAEISIYFDGIVVESNDVVDSTLVNVRNQRFRLGVGAGHGNDFVGRMDDVRIFDKALSATAVAALFRGGDLGVAWSPSPGDFKKDVPRDANLGWQPGSYAVEHRVFFGTSWDDVNSMSEPCSVQDACDYDPGTLALNTTYFWRIDEVNDPCVWRGNIWRFTVADFITVDDFEEYDTSGNRVYNTWCDQRCQEWEETGSWLTLTKGLSYRGNQSVEYWYNCNDPYAVYNYAEAWLPLASVGFTDWTSVDVRLLTLFFYGDPINTATSTEQMYVGVKDTDGLYGEMRYGDHSGEALTDIQVAEWQRWDLPFVWFTDSNSAAPNDVNFASMESVHIGFGNRRTPVAGGEGWVNFDDIRLSLPVCRPEYGPAADFSGNCIVDIADVGILGEQWLRKDVNFLDDLGIVVQAPIDANLLGHWKLDEGTGTFAEDSSVNDYHGTLELTDDGGYSWVSGHIGSGAVEFGGGRMYVDDGGSTPKLRPVHQVSVCAWIYILQEMNAARCVVKGTNDHESYELEIDGTDTLVFQFRDGNHPGHTRYDVTGTVRPDEWIHAAGTYDGSTMVCYVNGEVEESQNINNPSGLAQDPNYGLSIGNKARGDANDTPFEGIIDDVRVYDYGLSQAEVAWLVTEGTGVFLLNSPVNIFSGEDPEVINFRDLATVMESWLEEKLWPPE